MKAAIDRDVIRRRRSIAVQRNTTEREREREGETHSAATAKIANSEHEAL